MLNITIPCLQESELALPPFASNILWLRWMLLVMCVFLLIPLTISYYLVLCIWKEERDKDWTRLELELSVFAALDWPINWFYFVGGIGGILWIYG